MRLKSKRVAEKDVSFGIIQLLRLKQAQGHIKLFTRHNGGGIKIKNRWVWFYRLWLKGEKPRSKDYPDFTGLMSDGRALYIEVKGEKTVITEGQQKVIDIANETPALACIAESADDVADLLKDYRPQRINNTYEQ